MDPPPVSTTPTTSPPPPLPITQQPPPEPTPPEDPPTTTPSPKIRLMCSYGGHIIPRPSDKSLCYIGGETRIIVIDRNTSLTDFQTRISKTIFKSKTFTLKYQLPNEDLDSLISISNNDDLENMIEEYDRINSANPVGSKTTRLRLFLFPDKSEGSVASIEDLLNSSSKSEDWFLEALNGVSVVSNASIYSESNSSVNNLLGLDDGGIQNRVLPRQQEEEGRRVGVVGEKTNGEIGHEVNSVPDSPMVGGTNTSSYGSGTSLPALANLPPIKVHLEEKGGGVLGIEDEFNQMSVGGGGGGAGSVAGSSPPAQVVGPVGNRVVEEDERSEQGGYVKVQQVMNQVQLQQRQPQQPAQFQQLPLPNSVSSDGSATNPLSRQQKQMVYQEQIMQMQSGNHRAGANVVVVDQKINDPNSRDQIPQPVQGSEYVMPTVYEQHPQLHQQQQFVHAGVQYIHSHTPGGMYYPVYHSQQQHLPLHQGSEQQFVYYMPPASRPPQAYNMPVQQQSYCESPVASQASRLQAPPHPTAFVNPAAAYNAMNVPAAKPEMAAGMYRTSATGAPQLVQHHPQYVGYQMQSIRPSSGASANYTYEYAEPPHTQMYYAQPMAPPKMMVPGNASQVPTESTKQQNNNPQL